LKIIIRRKPHARFIFMAVGRSKIMKGTMKEDATINFVRKVDTVASQISFCLLPFLDSSDMWMPRASENASAIATVRIPPMIASLSPVPAFSPIIRPSVVIIPEVSPKLTPIFVDSFM